jgi:hypothetical protein
MPEDDPEKCVGREAEAVSRYIHTAFYSREARERNHPARVELVRLTNRQYINSIADLLRHFTPDPTSVKPKRGLQATYYRSRDFRGDNKLLERVDAGIHFDFANTGPDGQPVGTNGLSAQWRGSLIAEESGDHEIVIKTSNGFRVWLNDDEDPLLMAGWPRWANTVPQSGLSEDEPTRFGWSFSDSKKSPGQYRCNGNRHMESLSPFPREISPRPDPAAPSS